VTLRTPLCELLGIEHPIVQAPITREPELPRAVAQAGALGTVSCSWTEAEGVGEAAARLRGLAVAFNFRISKPMEERIDAALESGGRIVSVFWGDPAPYVERVHAAGALLLATVGSAEEARRAEAAGADVVVAQGWEAGGHVRGGVATLPLVAAVVDAVDIPVIAAGGIGDGRGLAAVLVLGAQAGWLGTRFVASAECPLPYKDRLLPATETDTLTAGEPAGNWPEGAPYRVLAGDDRPYAGQSVGVVRDVKPAAEIVRDLVAEAERALARL
jgi:nitronate monooxygenase